MRQKVLVLAVLALGVWWAAPASAQPLGSYRWQLQPYCNIITVTVVQQGGQYQLDGQDDQCAAAEKASVVGLAFQNPNGTIGFGLTVVTAPAGTPVHVAATISITTLSGTWHDSSGNSGSFTFTPGAGTLGSARPMLPGGIPPLSITNLQIANNTIGAAQINSAEVQARITGSCPANQAIAAVGIGGTVTCVPIPELPATSPIVATHSASTFNRFSPATPTLVIPVGHLFGATGDGAIIMGLPSPPTIGTAQYRLSTVEYCLAQDTTNSAFITNAVVYHYTPGGSVLATATSDLTDRSATGCYTLAVPALNPQGYSLVLGLTGQTTNLASAGVVLGRVRTTWVPVVP